MVCRKLSWMVALMWFGLVSATAYAQDDDLYGDLPDPTRPLHKVQEPSDVAPKVEPSLTLSSIVLGADTRFAVINDRRVKVGDEINGVRVTEIRAREVIVEGFGARQNLRVLVQNSTTAVKDHPAQDSNHVVQ